MKAYFGDNQFLGVNHSSGKGSDYLRKYETAEDIAETLRVAWKVGIRDFCFTVNDKTIDAINIIINECPYNLHPALPYAHRVNDLILDKGLVGAVFYKARQFGLFSLVFAGFAALFGRNKKILELLIRSELVGIPMANVRSIGLLNVATDFVLGLNRADLLHDFYHVVTTEFRCKPVYYTMNFRMLADTLWGQGFDSCAIIFNYNKSGFRTNPSLGAVRSAVDSYKNRETIAMSLFSGSEADEVDEILSQVPSLSGVLFGSSREVNIRNNFLLLESHRTANDEK